MEMKTLCKGCMKLIESGIYCPRCQEEVEALFPQCQHVAHITNFFDLQPRIDLGVVPVRFSQRHPVLAGTGIALCGLVLAYLLFV